MAGTTVSREFTELVIFINRDKRAAPNSVNSTSFTQQALENETLTYILIPRKVRTSCELLKLELTQVLGEEFLRHVFQR